MIMLARTYGDILQVKTFAYVVYMVPRALHMKVQRESDCKLNLYTSERERKKTLHKPTAAVSTMYALHSRLTADDSELQ
ncbi:hypothetical protein TNCV_1401961 [Trichonephila clavipes]|nr:hypothetical protein TNCV_1401961 [Trichonephila clavipes]